MESKRFVTALYGRTSKDDPKRVTIEIQQKTLHDWAARDQMVESIIAEYWDDGVTGKLPLWERPEGKRLLDDVKNGKIQSVAVAYADRFGRTLLDGLQAVKVLEDSGVKLVAVNDGWDARRNDSPLYFQFRMMMAEEEHRRIAQRMSDGKRRAMDRDQAPPGGPVTFGYTLDSRGQLLPEPAQAALVIGVFQMLLCGYSQLEILDWAIKSGIPPGRRFQKRIASSPTVVATHRNAAWHLTKIGKILRNRIYIGQRKWGDRTFTCPALVDPDTFERVQAILAGSPHTGPGKKMDPAHGFMTGRLHCGLCGAKYYHKNNLIKRKNGKSDRYSMYVCDTMRRQVPGSKCNGKMLPVAAMDEQIWEEVEKHMRDPMALITKLVSSNVDLGSMETSLALEESRLLSELAAVEEEVKQTWAEQKANSWPMSWVSQRLNELNERRSVMEATLVESRTSRGALSLSREDNEEMLSNAAKWQAAIENGTLSPEEQMWLVHFLIEGGTVMTYGKGHHKTASTTLKLRLGGMLSLDEVRGKLVDPSLPKDWSYGSDGYATFPITFECQRSLPVSHDSD